jgi:hypothetical protein
MAELTIEVTSMTTCLAAVRIRSPLKEVKLTTYAQRALPG